MFSKSFSDKVFEFLKLVKQKQEKSPVGLQKQKYPPGDILKIQKK